MTNLKKLLLCSILSTTFIFLCIFNIDFILLAFVGLLFCYYYFFKIAVIQVEEKPERNPKLKSGKIPRSQRRRIWKKTWENF